MKIFGGRNERIRFWKIKFWVRVENEILWEVNKVNMMEGMKTQRVKTFSQCLNFTYGYHPSLIQKFKTVEPCGIQVLKNPNPLKDVEASALVDVVVLV